MTLWVVKHFVHSPVMPLLLGEIPCVHPLKQLQPGSAKEANFRKQTLLKAKPNHHLSCHPGTQTPSLEQEVILAIVCGGAVSLHSPFLCLLSHMFRLFALTTVLFHVCTEASGMWSVTLALRSP